MAQKRGFDFSLIRQYDKVLAVLVLVGLLVSLFVLARSGSESRDREQAHRRAVDALRPTVPLATPLDLQPYDQALRDLEHPLTAGNTSTNDQGVFVPDNRVWCVDCHYPIPYGALECPFCHAPQPPTGGGEQPQTKTDSDNDGMPDEWMVKYFKHPLAMAEDHSLANDDADNDGFSNIEEFQAHTSPVDPHDHPPYVSRMKLKEIHAKLFPFVFKSYSKMPNGKWKCAFNLKAEDRTWIVEEGQPVGNTGLTLETFEYKVDRRPNPKLNGNLSDVDVSCAHLVRPETKQTFLLRIDDGQAAMEQEIVITLTLLGKPVECRVSTGGILDVRGEKYKADVIGVDGQPQSVVLENVHTGEKCTVPQ